MTTILETLGAIWPYLLAACGVVFGLFRHQQAKTATAEAGQKAAEAEKAVAEKDAAMAAANQAGAQTGADNAKVRSDEDAAADALPTGDADRVLHDEWGKD